MLKNRKSLFVIVCLLLSETSSYNSDERPKKLEYKDPAATHSTLTRKPSLDFLRGDAIPWSITILPVTTLKSTGDLMFDHYGEEYNGKVIKIGEKQKDSIFYNAKLNDYIDTFIQHVNQVNEQNQAIIASEKHTKRAINIEHASMQATNYKLPKKTKIKLDAILYSRVNYAIKEWKTSLTHDQNNEALESNLMNELGALSESQHIKTLQNNGLHYQTDDRLNKEHLRLNLAVNQWKAQQDQQNYTAMYKELSKFSQAEQYGTNEKLGILGKHGLIIATSSDKK